METFGNTFNVLQLSEGDHDQAPSRQAAGATAVAACVAGQGFRPLPIGLAHDENAGALPGPHRDPFDRMLIAQAMIEDLILASNEAASAPMARGLLW